MRQHNSSSFWYSCFVSSNTFLFHFFFSIFSSPYFLLHIFFYTFSSIHFLLYIFFSHKRLIQKCIFSTKTPLSVESPYILSSASRYIWAFLIICYQLKSQFHGSFQFLPGFFQMIFEEKYQVGQVLNNHQETE